MHDINQFANATATINQRQPRAYYCGEFEMYIAKHDADMYVSNSMWNLTNCGNDDFVKLLPNRAQILGFMHCYYLHKFMYNFKTSTQQLTQDAQNVQILYYKNDLTELTKTNRKLILSHIPVATVKPFWT